MFESCRDPAEKGDVAALRMRTKRSIEAPTRCGRSVQDSVGTGRSRQRVHGGYARVSQFHGDSVAVRRNTGWTIERGAVQNAQDGNEAVAREAKARPKIIIHPEDMLACRSGMGVRHDSAKTSLHTVRHFSTRTAAGPCTYLHQEMGAHGTCPRARKSLNHAPAETNASWQKES